MTQFSKYSGCGNDFIVIDNRSGNFPVSCRQYIRFLCHRRVGIGADGVLLLESSTQAEFRMRIFNSDSSEAKMCGNGIRCLMKFIARLHPDITAATIETAAGLMAASIKRGAVQIAMPEPGKMETVLLEGSRCYHLDTGVPHLVCFTEDLEGVDLAEIGPKLRHHPQFSPAGANVNFASITPQGIRYRTYERGVEEETLACGTGAVAVALVASQINGTPSPVAVITSLGQKIEISFQKGEKIDQVKMVGPADHIFDGILPEKELSSLLSL